MPTIICGISGAPTTIRGCRTGRSASDVCGDVSPIARDYLLDDLSADASGYELVKSVHIEAVAADPIAESQWLQDLADRSGFPHGIVARAELDAPDVEQVLARQAEFANVRGIRHIVNWHREPRLTFTSRSDLLTDPAWLAGFGLLRKYGLSFDLQLYPSQMDDAYAVAKRHPEHADRSSTIPACRSTVTPTGSRNGATA